MAELGNQPPRRLHRQKQKPQQRGLAGARRAREKLEGMRINAEREVAQNLRSQPVAQANVLESDHPPLSDKFAIRRPNHCPAVVLDTYGNPSPARIPVQNCAVFLQDYGEPAIAVRAKVSNSSHVSRGCHGFRSINGRLVPWHPNDSSAPCSSSARIAQRRMRSNRPRWARRAVRFAAPAAKPLGSRMAQQAVPEMATAVAASEAEEAFTGVIRPDQRANDSG